MIKVTQILRWCRAPCSNSQWLKSTSQRSHQIFFFTCFHGNDKMLHLFFDISKWGSSFHFCQVLTLSRPWHHSPWHEQWEHFEFSIVFFKRFSCKKDVTLENDDNCYMNISCLIYICIIHINNRINNFDKFCIYFLANLNHLSYNIMTSMFCCFQYFKR